MKQYLKRLLRQQGLHIYTNGSLPRGVDVYQDIKRWPERLEVKTIFDVGANVGQTCLELVAEFPGATILAFEPIKATFTRLSSNTQHLRQVKAFNFALGSAKGSCLVRAQPESVFNSLIPNSNLQGKEFLEERVQIETIDEFCVSHGIDYIDFLKTDTEGYDLEVLRGADNYLESGKIRSILSEVTFSENNTQNTHFFPVYNYLTSKGFRFYGLYDTYFSYINPSSLAFCNALFVKVVT